MLERHKIELREIISNYYGTTYRKLVQLTKVSEKTIRSDIKVLKEMIDEAGLMLEIKGEQISIPFDRKEEFVEFYRKLRHRDYSKDKVDDSDIRKMRIVIELVEAEDYLSMEELAARLFVSKASIHACVHTIAKMIEENGLGVLSITSRKGIFLESTESQKRLLLYRLFLDRKNLFVFSKYLVNYLDNDLLALSESLGKVTMDFLKAHDMALSENNTYSLVINTLITVQRNRQGHYLEHTDQKNIYFFNEYTKMLRSLGIEVKSTELNYISIIDRNQKEIVQNDSYRVFIKTKEFLKRRYGIELSVDDSISVMLNHIEYLLQNGPVTTDQGPLIYETMLRRFLSAYVCGIPMFKEVESILGTKLETENRCYIALYLQMLFLKNFKSKAKILLFEPNMALCNLLAQELLSQLTQKVSMTLISNRWEIEEKLAQDNYDLVLTYKSIPLLFNHIPALHISQVPTKQEIEQIQEILKLPKKVHIQDVAYGENHILVDEYIIEFGKERLELNDELIVLVYSDLIKSGIYTYCNEESKRVYVINYNSNTDFSSYLDILNRVGLMIAE